MNEERDQSGQGAASAPSAPAARVTSESIDIGEEKPAPDAWKMPSPVFRQTSGYVPRGYEKRPSDGAETSAVVPPPPEIATAPAAAPPDTGEAIQPQPDISLDFPPEEIQAALPEKPQKSEALRIFMAVLGIGAMILFALAFIAVVFYLFFYRVNESQDLNQVIGRVAS